MACKLFVEARAFTERLKQASEDGDIEEIISAIPELAKRKDLVAGILGHFKRSIFVLASVGEEYSVFLIELLEHLRETGDENYGLAKKIAIAKKINDRNVPYTFLNAKAIIRILEKQYVALVKDLMQSGISQDRESLLKFAIGEIPVLYDGNMVLDIVSSADGNYALFPEETKKFLAANGYRKFPITNNEKKKYRCEDMIACIVSRFYRGKRYFSRELFNRNRFLVETVYETSACHRAKYKMIPDMVYLASQDDRDYCETVVLNDDMAIVHYPDGGDFVIPEKCLPMMAALSEGDVDTFGVLFLLEDTAMPLREILETHGAYLPAKSVEYLESVIGMRGIFSDDVSAIPPGAAAPDAAPASAPDAAPASAPDAAPATAPDAAPKECVNGITDARLNDIVSAVVECLKLFEPERA